MIVQHIANRLRTSGWSQLRCVSLLSNDLYLTRLEISNKRKSNHQLRQAPSYTSPFPGSRVKRDAVDKLDLWLQDDSVFKLKAQPMLSYIDGFDLNLNEIICITNGLTNMDLKIGDNIYHTRLLRKLGCAKFKFCLLRNTIFINDKYLTSSQVDIHEDLRLFHSSEIVFEFLKWNRLHQFSLINRELLINEKLPSDEFKAKRADLWKKTSIGSFYTMLGILLIKYDEQLVNDFITDKVITGKRGIIDIVKLKQL